MEGKLSVKTTYSSLVLCACAGLLAACAEAPLADTQVAGADAKVCGAETPTGSHLIRHTCTPAMSDAERLQLNDARRMQSQFNSPMAPLQH